MMILPRMMRCIVPISIALLVTIFPGNDAFAPRTPLSTRNYLTGWNSEMSLNSRRQTIRQSSLNGRIERQEDEWHPCDPAYTTPQLLSALWFMIAQGSTMSKGETSTVMFPQMEDEFSPSYLNRLLGHLDACKDVCDYFGTQTVLVPYVQKGKVAGFTVKSYRDPDKDNDAYEFDYDPFWDDGEEWNYDGIDEKAEGGKALDQFPDIVNRIPDDDDQIIDVTKTWVDKMMSDMGICPFTSGPNMAGLPMGKVFYTVDRCSQMEDMYARYWKEVVRVEQNNEKDLSTTLLIAPEFCMENIELFESFSNTLTQPLAALGVEDLLQLVFFHPVWTFRDGGERSGLGTAANYARRSPWPMINILRTKQVRAAQKGIPTGLVYQQNEKTLMAIGADKLETMLRLRDWSDIAEVKVNRRDMEALRVAQDYQQTGVIKKEDTRFEYDATPAANKVDRKQVEEGNMIIVIKQALEKRLGLSNGEVTRLSGPETSATIMASDFLLQELNRIAASGPTKLPTEAQRMLLEDVQGIDDDDKEEMAGILFGKGGLVQNPEDPDFSIGLNPNAFY